jgi:hypothetical protein
VSPCSPALSHRWLLLAVLLSALSACGGPAKHRGPYDLSGPLDPMVGADVGELITAFGEPTDIVALPTGRRAFIYASRASTHTHPDGRRCIDSYVIDHDNMVSDFICR